MNLKDMLSRAKKSNKNDIIPGTIDSETQELCPACMDSNLIKLKKCCGAAKGKLQCRKCGYTVIL